MTRERLAARYEEHHATARSPGLVIDRTVRSDFFAARIGRGKTVLDLGCRDGALAAAYLAGNRVTGVDVDRAALERAAAAGLETVWADLEEPLPFDDGTFDVVVAGELLPHLRYPADLVAEARRVLRPGGVFLGSVPNAYRLKARVQFALGRQLPPDPTQFHLISPGRLRSLLAAHFASVELEFVASRFLRLSPRLFGNTILFAAS